MTARNSQTASTYNLLKLEVNQLKAHRGEQILFENVSFSLNSGQALTLRGSNGTGKSTLLRIVANLLKPINGTVSLYDSDNSQLPISLFSHYLSDKNAMKPQLTVWQNLWFWYNFFSIDKTAPKDNANAIIYHALDQVKMEAYLDLPFAALSTGQKRRVALSRLLVSPRNLWLLDEPTSGLDQESSTIFSQICQSHLKRGGLIIAATHIPLQFDIIQSITLSKFKPNRKELQFMQPLALDTYEDL